MTGLYGATNGVWLSCLGCGETVVGVGLVLECDWSALGHARCGQDVWAVAVGCGWSVVGFWMWLIFSRNMCMEAAGWVWLRCELCLGCGCSLLCFGDMDAVLVVLDDLSSFK